MSILKQYSHAHVSNSQSYFCAQMHFKENLTSQVGIFQSYCAFSIIFPLCGIIQGQGLWILSLISFPLRRDFFTAGMDKRNNCNDQQLSMYTWAFESWKNLKLFFKLDVWYNLDVDICPLVWCGMCNHGRYVVFQSWK